MTTGRVVAAAALLGAAGNAAACGLLAWQAAFATLPYAAANAAAAQVFDCRIEACRQLAKAELDRMRGGFFDDTSLKISIGIDRIVAIGDELIAVTTLTIPDLSRAANSGLGNSATEALLPAALTLIQNSFDNQQIRNMTQLNISVSGLDLARSLELAASLQQSLERSLR